MLEIFEHAAKEAPRECCGLIIGTEENKKYIPCENLFEKEDGFQIDPLTFSTYELTSNILYIVHSHYEGDCTPSQLDINTCNEIGIPYLIVSYPDKDIYILKPDEQKSNIIR